VKGENSFPERVLQPTVEYVKENMCQCRVYSHISLCSHWQLSIDLGSAA
jgi:hypothetical protein